MAHNAKCPKTPDWGKLGEIPLRMSSVKFTNCYVYIVPAALPASRFSAARDAASVRAPDRHLLCLDELINDFVNATKLGPCARRAVGVVSVFMLVFWAGIATGALGKTRGLM